MGAGPSTWPATNVFYRVNLRADSSKGKFFGGQIFSQMFVLAIELHRAVQRVEEEGGVFDPERSFLSFPFVYPEPVLVKLPFLDSKRVDEKPLSHLRPRARRSSPPAARCWSCSGRRCSQSSRWRRCSQRHHPSLVPAPGNITKSILRIRH